MTAFVPASADTCFAWRVLKCMEYHATGGTTRVSTRTLQRETGIYVRGVQRAVRDMVASGALEVLEAAKPIPNGATLYRIARPDLVKPGDARPRWSPERVALLKARYADTPTRQLCDMLNELPGPEVTDSMAHGKAGWDGLKRGPELLSAIYASRRPQPAQTAPEPIQSAKSVSGMRFASSVTSRSPVINWSALPPPSPAVKGRCRWALSCAEPAVGSWCVGHAALLRGRRSEAA